jgi:TPR repeat protein
MKKLLAAMFVALLMVGCGEERGDETEFERTKRLAEDGDAVAQHNLGHMYHLAKGVPRDFAEAVKWYRKAAEQGNADGQRSLGFCFGNGDGVPKDDVQAFKWYRKAAEQGNAIAQAYLGYLYANGNGIPKDDVQAYAFYNLAAANGQEDAKKQRDELELTNEQKAEAQALSAELHQQIEAKRTAKREP